MVRVWFTALFVTLLFSFLNSEEDNFTRAEEAIWFYRDIGRPFHTRHELAASWSHIGFPINPIVWFTYYVILRDVIMYFKRQESIGTLPKEKSTLYVYESVISPFSVIHHALFRYQMYDFFLFNTPSETYALIWRIRFRLFFMSTTTVLRKEIFCGAMIYAMRPFTSIPCISI